jgi:hypothetical protein
MLPAPPSISNQSNQIATVLDEWASPRGGKAVVVSTVTASWIQSYQSSQKPLIMIYYMGQISRGDFSVMNRNHRVDRGWKVVVKRGRGFNSIRGDSLTETVGNMEPFTDSVEAIELLCRTMIGISEEIPIDYKSTTNTSKSAEIIDEFTIMFGTANDLPAIQRIPSQPAN